MNIVRITLLGVFFLSISLTFAQPDNVKKMFPEGTVYFQNVPYANDTVKKHLLDIYLPPNAKPNTPVIIWIHGGAWMVNDKYADMSYMQNTVHSIVANGYAVVSIDHRYSTTAVFPAQIRDCYQALEFLYHHAEQYKLDKNRFALIGFSSGAHLAALLGLSLNNNVTGFYPDKKKPSFTIKAVLDYYGPSDLLLFYGNSTPDTESNPIDKLLNASPLTRPDLSKQASPTTYVDKGDPPFFIVHGEKDKDVPIAQSYLLKSYLDLSKIDNELTIVKDAPHYGEMFDMEKIRDKLFAFLKEYL